MKEAEGFMEQKRYHRVLGAIVTSLLFALCVCGTALGQGPQVTGQAMQVSGTVTSSTTGEKLWGVTVRVKGTGTQTVTDQQGRYALVAPADAVLTFAIIGYRGTEQPVEGRSTIDVAMEQAPTQLQEVVVTGYTSQRRADITGAVSSVNLENAGKQTTTSVLQRLDGRVPGVTVDASGSPGSRSTVRLRGVSSFHDNDPLYIVDGTPVEETYMNFLNPNDIGEMQVLKDASSASIYGSRASNGVIIIETKKGRPGGRQASLDVRTGVATPTRGYDDFVMTDALQYFQAAKRSWVNSGQPVSDDLTLIFGDPDNPTIPPYIYVFEDAILATDAWGRPISVDESMYAFPGPDNGGSTLIMPASAGTNWWDAVFSPAQYTDANLALSGGGSDNSYNVSFSYLKQNGTAAYSQFQRGTLRVNTAFNINKLTIGENIAFSRERSYGGLDDGNLGENNIVGKNILMPPVVPVYDIAGHFASSKAGGLGNNTNPLGYAFNRRFDRNTNDRAIGSVFASLSVIPEVSVGTRFSFNLGQGSFRGFTPLTPENSEPGRVTQINENDSRSTSWTLSNTLNWLGTTGSHNLAVLVGQEAISSNSHFVAGSIANLLNEDPASRYIDDGLGNPTTKNVSSSGTFDRLLSFFGKADYNYNQRYYASVTVRRDGSSKFGEGNQWGTFPAFSVGWRASRESFFPQDGFISNAMLRFGWGVTGNQRIPGGRIVAKFGGNRGDTFYDIGGTGSSIEAGFRQIALGNPDIQWEEQRSTNVGLDLEFLSGGGNFTVDLYERITDKLLFDPRTPATAGLADPAIKNVGKVSNRGIDFTISYSGTAGSGKVWSVAFNGSHYRNKILRIAEGVESFFGGSTSRLGTAVINKLGGPIGAFYGYQANGYFADSAEAFGHNLVLGTCPEAPCQVAAKVGRLRFIDVNGDGLITSADRTVIGSPHPDFTAGLDLGFRMGAWDFSATIFGSFGNDILDAQKNFYVFHDFDTNVMKDRLTDSFCLPADEGCTNPYDLNAKYPRIDRTDEQSRQISSFYIEDGTYVRLRTLQVAWTVPANLIRWIPAARVYVQAENLFTITGYPGVDPALPAPVFTGPAGDIRDQFRGVDQGTYPSNRTFTIGISTQF
jgi:TonB-linked SusC/RagA family outer membrane protein